MRRTPTGIDFGGLSDDAQDEDWLNRIKAQAKRKLGRFYPLAVQALAPVYGDTGARDFLRGFDLSNAVVADLGSGTKNHGDKVVCIDGYGYESVHIVADLGKLPFADESVDGLMSEAVLEHVIDPQAHVAEMFRVLKPGGRILCVFPFLVAFHAAPYDYTRLTRSGLIRLFSQFEVDRVFVSAGPTSSLLWTFQEWLAMVGSLGNEKLYRALVPVTWLLSPLKYIDILLIRHPAAHVIAAGFSIIATKPLPR